VGAFGSVEPPLLDALAERSQSASPRLDRLSGSDADCSRVRLHGCSSRSFLNQTGVTLRIHRYSSLERLGCSSL
jgi:hypothetical protein